MSESVLPLYVVCDESYSMGDHLETLNNSLREAYHEIGTNRDTAGKVWLCLVAFSGTAKVLVPLSSSAERTGSVRLAANAASNYGAAFALLRDTIEADMAELDRAGRRPCRPVVLFVSDGQPTDPASWPSQHARLREESWPSRPHIISYGVDDADAETIRRVGVSRSFLSRTGMTVAAVVREATAFLSEPIAITIPGRTPTFVPA